MNTICGERYIDITFHRNDKGTAHICGVKVAIIGNKVHVSFSEYGTPKVRVYDKYKLHLRIDMKTKVIIHNAISKPFFSFLNFMW